MDMSLLHPQLRSAYRFLPNPPVRRAWSRRLTRAATGLMPPPRMPTGVDRRVVQIRPGLRTRVFTPQRATGAGLLWIHGGGLVIGAAVQDDTHCAAVAVQLGLVVVSAEYRLAPAHPFPAPLDDCLAAWGWLVASGRADERRLAVGGQSAGGGLAAALVQRLHDERTVQPIAQWLFCPMLDDRTAADTALDAVRHPLWDNLSNRAGWAAYLAVAPGAAVMPPYAVPSRRQDLAGLPPTWIGTGTVELFHDEDVAYAQALTAAGVDVTLDEVAGAPHAFERLAAHTPVAREYLGRSFAWLDNRLAD